MTKPSIIGICGKAGSGKDTVAALIASKHVARFHYRSFTVRDSNDASPPTFVPGAQQAALADALKFVAMDIWGFSPQQLWGPSAERNKPDARWPREHVVATSMFGGGPLCVRCNTPAVKLVEGSRCDFLTPREALQVLGTEGGRHIHEDSWVRLLLKNVAESHAPLTVVTDIRYDNEARAVKEAGGVIWRLDRASAGLKGAAASHASERGISEELVDMVLDNNGSLDELKTTVSMALWTSGWEEARAYRMDAVGGPRCWCGDPSLRESGACGRGGH